MLTKFLHRLFARRTEPAAPDEHAFAPLTVMAAEPQRRAVEMIDVDNLYFPWLIGAGTAVAQDLSAAENRILRALKREADTDSATTVDLVPRLPSVIPLLLHSLRDRNVSTGQLAAQLSQDAVLVAAALRQVNSSYFRRAAPVKTIEEAIAVLGLNGLRMLIASVAFKPLFNPGLGHFTALGAPRVWTLAQPYEAACRHVAQHSQVDAFALYLAGLLQNVGTVVALRVTDQAGGAAPNELRSLAFHGSFSHYTRRLACVVGRHWEFPEQVTAALDRDKGAPGTPASPAAALAEALRAADRTAKIFLLVKHGVLHEEQAHACLEGDGVAACYRAIAQAHHP